MTLKYLILGTELREGRGGEVADQPDEAERDGVILNSFGCQIPPLLPAGPGYQVDVELLELENVCI